MTKQMRIQSDLSLSRLNQLLRYEASTGIFYRRLSSGRRKAGDEAGYLNNKRYRLIWLDGKWFLAHRIAWYLCTSTWPENEIDHINGDPSDNRIENLRHVTRSQNMMNAKTSKKGWHYHSKYKKWQALIRLNKKRIYLGRFDTEAEAKAAYIAAVKKYHGEFSVLNRPPPKPKPAIQEGFDL